MARLLPPEWAVRDNNGDAVGGAKIFFYAPGTATKQTTYSNDILQTANSNPIICGADGQLPNDVFAEDSIDFKMVVAPADDTDPPTSPINTYDPLRDLLDESNTINVRDFGAIGDGTTAGGGNDDTVAINAAIAAAVATGFRSIKFPPGAYRTTSIITLNNMNSYWEAGAILKDHAGIGLEFTGGAARNFVQGRMLVAATDAHEHPLNVSKADGEHGIVFNSRMDIVGLIESRGHKGNAFQHVGDTNCNYSSYRRLLGRNSEKAWSSLITADNSAVWYLDLESKQCWDTGFEIDGASLFGPRAWDVILRSEDCGRDDIAPGVHISSGTGMRFFVYSENQNSGKDIELGQSSPTTLEQLTASTIFDTRGGSLANNVSSVDNVIIMRGGEERPRNDTCFKQGVTATDVTDDAADTLTENIFLDQGANVDTKIWGGDGTFEQIIRNTSNQDKRSGHKRTGAGETNEYYSGGAVAAAYAELLKAHRGTPDTPTTVVVGDIIYSSKFNVDTGAGEFNVFELQLEVVSVGGGNKAGVDAVIYNVDGGAGGSLVEVARLHDDGKFAFKSPTISFTPEIADASTSGNVASLGSSSGLSVVSGNMCIVTIDAGNIDTTGLTGGNLLFIRNLPVTAAALATGSVFLNGFTFAGNYVNPVIGSGNNHINLQETTTNGANNALTVAAVDTSSSDIKNITIVYPIA